MTAAAIGSSHCRSAVSEDAPHVVGFLTAGGDWQVLLMITVPGAASIERALDADAAEKLARELLVYAALVRERLGLPGGVPFRPTASLHEATE